MNPKENGNEIIELTAEELGEFFADDDFDGGEEDGEIRSFYFSNVSHVSKRHFPNGNRRQPPPCLPKSETDGRKSMAAQPFILTIDGGRLFCYLSQK